MSKTGRNKKTWLARLVTFGELVTRPRDGKDVPMIEVWINLDREPDRGVLLQMPVRTARRLAHSLNNLVDDAREGGN